MSQWTHVNASIRFDTLFSHPLPTDKELGKICRWEDKDTSHWFKDLPCGSEGSIEYRIVETGPKNSVASHVIVFTGDLRDYDDDTAILNYFKKITKGKMIRSGILEIDIEFHKTYVYQFDNNLDNNNDAIGWIPIREVDSN